MNMYRDKAMEMQARDIEGLDDVNHRLWHRMDRAHRLAERCLRAEQGGRFSRGRDGSRGQGRVLKALTLVPEISQKDLMMLLDMRQQSLAELLAKLEAKGLIQREPAADDRRKQMVRLTEEGRVAAEEVALAEGEQPSFAFFDCLTDDEKESFEGYLERVGASLEEAVRAQDDEAAHGRRRHGRGRNEGGRGSRRRGDVPEGRESDSRGEGGRQRGRRGGGGKGAGPRFKVAPQAASEIGETTPGAPSCDHHCRTCPLKAQGTCVMRR